MDATFIGWSLSVSPFPMVVGMLVHNDWLQRQYSRSRDDPEQLSPDPEVSAKKQALVLASCDSMIPTAISGYEWNEELERSPV